LVGIISLLLASCNLYLTTQVGFQNSTGTYTFDEIKIASIDITTPLPPSSTTSFFTVDSGSYTLYTKGTNGIWYQWPAPQTFQKGYSCLITFSINSQSVLTYSAYQTMIAP